MYNTEHTTPRYKRYEWRFNETNRIPVDIIQLETCTDKQTDRQQKGRASHFRNGIISQLTIWRVLMAFNCHCWILSNSSYCTHCCIFDRFDIIIVYRKGLFFLIKFTLLKGQSFGLCVFLLLLE